MIVGSEGGSASLTRRVVVAVMVVATASLWGVVGSVPGWDIHGTAVQGGELVPTPPNRPNIVFILTDDQPPLDSVQTMPFLSSRPGGHWVEFTNAFVNNPLCCPSRATILTGLNSHHHGLLTNQDARNFNDSSTVATWLKSAGYRTGLVGKYINNWPNGRPPWVPVGWDDWFAFAGQEAYYNYNIYDNGTLVSHGSTAADYSTDVFAAEAESFIASSTDPFFLYLAPFAPHAPLKHVAPRHANLSIPVSRSPNFNESDVSDKPAWVRALPYLTPAQEVDRDRNRERTFRVLRAADDAIRRVYQALETRGILDDTIIVFMTDNGYMWGEHRDAGKGCVYEECIRTPLLIRYPWAESRIETRLVSNADIAPTFARLAGVFPPTPVDGRSLVPLLENTATSWRSRLLFQYRGGGNPSFWAIRNERWKYVELETGERELYDLQADPWEMDNLASLPEYGPVQSQLAAELAAMRNAPAALMLPLLSVDDASVVEGDAGETAMTFTVSLSEPSPQSVSVNYATQDGTATAGSDYTATTGTLTFASGELALNVSVPIFGDTLGEADEALSLILSNATNAGIDRGAGVGTIVNDDTEPAVSVDDVSVVEGANGTTVTASFTVRLAFPASATATVDYATEDVSASAGSDYVAANGTLVFEPGETSQVVTVTVQGDALYEDNETFAVNLSNASLPVSDGRGVGTIVNDDPRPSATINDLSLSEGHTGYTTFTFTVTLSAPVGSTSTVNFATLNGSAIAPGDYVAATGTLTFQPGEQTRTIDILVVGDPTSEGNERFTVLLSGPTNMVLADDRGVGTIRNDDGKS